MKLRTKLITAFLALSLIPILSFSILVYLYFKDTMTASSRDKLIALASIQEERVNGILDKYLSKVLLVTSRTRLRDLIESYSRKEDAGKHSEIVRILEDARGSAQMLEISVLDTGGRVIASTDPSETGRIYSGEQLFLRGKEKCSVVDITEDRKRGSSVIISGPFILKDRLVGVVLIKDSGREIAALAGDYTGMGESGETTLAKRDLNGDALYIVPVRFRSDAAMRLRVPKGDLSRTMPRALNGEERYLESALDYRGVEVSAATRYIPSVGWGLTVEIDRAEVLRPLRYLYAVLIVTGLFLLTVVVAIAIYLSRRITAPVTRLEIAAQGISLGDYSCRADVTTGDELAALALSFNKMAESLLRSRDELDRKIADKEMLEKELRKVGAYNRSLIEASLDPLVTISAEGKINDVNAATEQITGCPRDLLIGTDFSDYFTEPEKAREGYETVFREGEVKDYPLEIRHRDGSITPVLYNASVYRDETGGVMGVFAAARTLDAMLRVSEKKLRDITRAMGEGIIVMDDRGRLTFMNPEAERLLGLTEKEMLHRDIHSIIHSPETGAEDCPILRVISTGEPYHSWDDFFIRRDGARFPVSLSSSPVLSEGRVAGVVTAFRDISERKAMEQKIKSYTEALETSNKELEQFAYVASHDLQEPLRKVTSFAELLDRRYRGRLDEKADTYIHFIVDGAIRMNTLINDLLAYSRVTTRAKEFAPTDLSEVVSRVSRDLSMVIEESNTSLTSDALPTVMADETQMGQIFQNLISNAIKFRGQEPSVIHVSAERVSDLLSRRDDLPPSVTGRLRAISGGWVISVKDNGIGIEPRFFERIFQLFQRLHTQEEYPGTGIGLAVCKKVVERHRGVIWVESEAGKGATFSFAIPDRGDYGREERD